MGVSSGLRTQQLLDTMFSRFQPIARSFSTSSVDNVAVAVMGAAGGIGQPLSMLLKLNPAVSNLSLYDIVHTVGVAADLSHIETKARVAGYVGADQLEASLEGAEIVVIPAGVPRKPGDSHYYSSHLDTEEGVSSTVSHTHLYEQCIEPGGHCSHCSGHTGKLLPRRGHSLLSSDPCTPTA